MVKTINRMKEELFEEVKDAPYELPEGWKWVTLKNVAKIIMGQSPPSLTYNKDGVGIPFYQGKKEFGEVYLKESSIWCSEPKKLANPGDILISVRAPVGDVNITKNKCAIGRGLAIIRPKNLLSLFYVFYFLKYYKLFWEKKGKGSTFKAIKKTDLENLLIPLPFKDGKPDFEKQKQIVERIEALFKEIDKAIELRQKAIEETRKLFDSVLDRIFREAEKDKKNWKWVKLKDLLASLESGKRPRGGAVENGIPSIGGEHLNSDGGFNFHKMKYIPEDFYKTLKKGKIQINDILVVKDGATTGKVSFVSEEFPYKKAAVNEHIFILRVKNDYIPKYVFWFLFSPAGQKEILKNFGGAAQGGINRKFVKNVDIPIPITKNGKLDLQKQRQIAEYLDSIHNKIKQLIVLQSIQLEKFGQLKESILNKAFRGELI